MRVSAIAADLAPDYFGPDGFDAVGFAGALDRLLPALPLLGADQLVDADVDTIAYQRLKRRDESLREVCAELEELAGC